MPGTMCRALRTETENEICHVVLCYVSLVGKAKNKRVSYLKRKLYIVTMSLDRLQKQDLFLRGTKSKCADIVENRRVTTLSSQVPETILLTSLFREQVSLASYFSRIFFFFLFFFFFFFFFFAPQGPCRLFTKYRSVIPFKTFE